MLEKIGWLCLAWAALLLLGLSAGQNAPFALALLGTALYIMSIAVGSPK